MTAPFSLPALPNLQQQKTRAKELLHGNPVKRMLLRDSASLITSTAAPTQKTLIRVICNWRMPSTYRPRVRLCELAALQGAHQPAAQPSKE